MMKTPCLQSAALATLLFLAACGGSDNGSATSYSYLVVVDAGSSGSRANVYKSTPSGGFVDIQDLGQIDSASVKPLAGFAADPAQAGPQGIKPLLDAVTGSLADTGVAKSQVRVDVLATAGMRLLEQSNPGAVGAIYASVRDAITADGYQPGRAETISGASEGLYAWVDVNYLSRSFQNGGATRGIVEVGGASTQVAYALGDAGDARATTLLINGSSYPVLSVSFLGLGQNEARKAMIGLTGTIGNPCYPNNDAASAPASFTADTASPSYTIASANFRYADCASAYRAVLNDYNLGRGVVAAGFNGTDFVGLSSIFFVMRDWGALARPTALGSRVEAQCSGVNAWSLQVAPTLNGTSKFAQNACANGTYIHALLFDAASGLGLQGSRLNAVDKINGAAPSWTRGYAVLNRTGQVP